jgi:hypothetical protein
LVFSVLRDAVEMELVSLKWAWIAISANVYEFLKICLWIAR